RLFLEKRYAQRPAQYIFKFFRWIVYGIYTITSPQVGMHHIALYRAGAYDRYLDHQVIKLSWLQSRQHRHLRPAFNLENPKRIRMADHLINIPIVLGYIGQCQVEVIMLLCKLKPFADTGEHSQAQHIHL